MWILSTVIAIAASIALHFWWRRKFRNAQEQESLTQRSWEKRLSDLALGNQNQQQTLFNSMVEGLLLLDETGRVQLANRAFANLFGVATAVQGKTILEVLRQHELADLLKRVGIEKQVLGYELKLSGSAERVLQVNAALIADNAGMRRGTILVFHDLTRLKQLERTREEFVANVSHELRTPLSLIKGYTETLLEGAKEDPEITTRFLQIIQRNSERLQYLIEDLLTISELESGRWKMNLQMIQLRPFVDRILDELRSGANAREVALINQVPELSVRADVDRLQQVLGNLVGNAIKYGRLKGTVIVRGCATESEIQICVQDDGPGIPAEALERVFERFYRVDKARSREQGGTGLGLSIVKHIVLSHGGRVWAASEAGKGAAFYFALPRTTSQQL